MEEAINRLTIRPDLDGTFPNFRVLSPRPARLTLCPNIPNLSEDFFFKNTTFEGRNLKNPSQS